MVAPKSIIASAKSPARSSGVMASARSRNRALFSLIGATMPFSRAITRSTFVSTTTARRSKAMAAIAAAV